MQFMKTFIFASTLHFCETEKLATPSILARTIHFLEIQEHSRENHSLLGNYAFSWEPNHEARETKQLASQNPRKIKIQIRSKSLRDKNPREIKILVRPKASRDQNPHEINILTGQPRSSKTKILTRPSSFSRLTRPRTLQGKTAHETHTFHDSWLREPHISQDTYLAKPIMPREPT